MQKSNVLDQGFKYCFLKIFFKLSVNLNNNFLMDSQVL